MRGDHIGRLIAARDDDERYVEERPHAMRRRRHLLERGKMVRHRSKAFRLTPDFLHQRVHLRRKLADLADEPLQRASGGRTEDLDERSRNARRAAGQQRETGSHHAQSRQQRPDPG